MDAARARRGMTGPSHSHNCRFFRFFDSFDNRFDSIDNSGQQER
jgi:hypothetical protein